MTSKRTTVRRSALIAAVVYTGLHLYAQLSIPGEFRGEWVPAGATCESPLKLTVDETTVTLVNGADRQTWDNVALPTSFFGPDYTGIIVVALPDFEESQPFIVYFNADENKGVTKVSIDTGTGRPVNPTIARLQSAARALAKRFPLSDVPLRSCGG